MAGERDTALHVQHYIGYMFPAAHELWQWQHTIMVRRAASRLTARPDLGET